MLTMEEQENLSRQAVMKRTHHEIWALQKYFYGVLLTVVTAR